MSDSDFDATDFIDRMASLFSEDGISASTAHGLALCLLDQDVVFFNEGEVAWDGTEHSLEGMQFNSAELPNYPEIAENPEPFANCVAGAMAVAEANPSLHVSLDRIHDALHEVLLHQDMTGMTLMNLAAWHMLKVRQLDDTYAVMIDLNMVKGIPDAYELVAELLKSLRQAEEIEASFDIVFMTARNLDALDGVMIDEPVKGAEWADAMKTMHVECD